MYDLQAVVKSTVGANDGSDSETAHAAGFPAFSNTAIDMFEPLQI